MSSYTPPLVALVVVVFEVFAAFLMPPQAWFRMNSILIIIILFFIFGISLSGCASKDIPPRHITDVMNCKVHPEDCR